MGYILTAATVATCPHGASIRNSTNHAREPLIDGHTIWIRDDKFVVMGCHYGERPCLDVEWARASPTITIEDVPVLTSDSIPSCRDSTMWVTGRAILVSYQNEQSDDD